MKRYFISTALAAALVVPAAALAQTATTAPAAQQMAAMTAADFVPMAASSNMFEIESSELALVRAQSADTRSFAQQMVQDHTAAGQSMMQAVAAAEMNVAAPAALAPRHQQMLDQLQAVPVSEFDAAYFQMQGQAHDEAVALFDAYARNGEAGPIREFAVSTLPVLQAHRQMLTTMGFDGTVTGATHMAPHSATGAMTTDDAMSSQASGATTATSGEGGASPSETNTPSGGVVPGQSPD